MPKGKEKPPKDANAPKRPQSSYFVFSNKRRPELQKQYSDKKVTDISKMISAEWKKMTESEKKPYEDKAKTLKEEYTKVLSEYKQTDEYKKFQKKLQQYKEKQKEQEQSDDEQSDSEDDDKKKKKKLHKNQKMIKHQNVLKRDIFYFKMNVVQNLKK